jgi:carboxy-terminal domain RNA polymerase II polypeptide A small phosphatase
MCKYFEVIMFTASIRKYAMPIFRKLDKNRQTKGMLFREHCTIDPKTQYMVKDLSKLGRNIEKVIIIDNSPNSYYYHPENSLPSKTWTKDS